MAGQVCEKPPFAVNDSYLLKTAPVTCVAGAVFLLLVALGGFQNRQGLAIRKGFGATAVFVLLPYAVKYNLLRPKLLPMKLSVIIPAFNEAASIGRLLHYLQQLAPAAELLVADGNSTDATVTIAGRAGATVVPCLRRGRGPQMNAGAAAASGDMLYFLHADTFPPVDLEKQLQQAWQQGYGSGCFRLRFDDSHWFLRLNAWFTRFDVDALRFGDQSLFVRREVFERAGGFNEEMLLLEDQEIIGRLRRVAPFAVLPACVVTSARKYRQHGIYRLQGCYFYIYALYRMGISQQLLLQAYKRLLAG